MHDATHASTTPLPSKKLLSRLFGLMAAVLVFSLLVGSFTLVLTLSKRIGPATAVRSRTHVTSTPLVIPPSCTDAQDHADEILCAEGQETTLNLTKHFSVTLHHPNGSANGTGIITITFLRAYADPIRLLLVYTMTQAPALEPGSDWGGFIRLSTAQGDLGVQANAPFKDPSVLSFDTRTLSAGLSQIQVHTINTSFGQALPLAFTLPFHGASTTVHVGQRVTKQGDSLTLERLTLTGSAATLTYTYTYPWSSQGVIMGRVLRLAINGQDQDLRESTEIDSSTLLTSGEGSMDDYQPLLGHTGTWSVTLTLVQLMNAHETTLFTVTFTFTV